MACPSCQDEAKEIAAGGIMEVQDESSGEVQAESSGEVQAECPSSGSTAREAVLVQSEEMPASSTKVIGFQDYSPQTSLSMLLKSYATTGFQGIL